MSCLRDLVIESYEHSGRAHAKEETHKKLRWELMPNDNNLGC